MRCLRGVPEDSCADGEGVLQWMRRLLLDMTDQTGVRGSALPPAKEN